MAITESNDYSRHIADWTGDHAVFSETLSRITDIGQTFMPAAIEAVENERRETVSNLRAETAAELVAEAGMRERKTWAPRGFARNREGTELSGPPDELAERAKVDTFDYFQIRVGNYSGQSLTVNFARRTGVDIEVSWTNAVQGRAIMDEVYSLLRRQRPWWWVLRTWYGTLVGYVVVYFFLIFAVQQFLVPTGFNPYVLGVAAGVLGIVLVHFAFSSPTTSPRFEIVKSGKKARASVIFSWALLTTGGALVSAVIRQILTR